MSALRSGRRLPTGLCRPWLYNHAGAVRLARTGTQEANRTRPQGLPGASRALVGRRAAAGKRTTLLCQGRSSHKQSFSARSMCRPLQLVPERNTTVVARSAACWHDLTALLPRVGCAKLRPSQG